MEPNLALRQKKRWMTPELASLCRMDQLMS